MESEFFVNSEASEGGDGFQELSRERYKSFIVLANCHSRGSRSSGRGEADSPFPVAPPRSSRSLTRWRRSFSRGLNSTITNRGRVKFDDGAALIGRGESKKRAKRVVPTRRRHLTIYIYFNGAGSGGEGGTAKLTWNRKRTRDLGAKFNWRTSRRRLTNRAASRYHTFLGSEVFFDPLLQEERWNLNNLKSNCSK